MKLNFNKCFVFAEGVMFKGDASLYSKKMKKKSGHR